MKSTRETRRRRDLTVKDICFRNPIPLKKKKRKRITSYIRAMQDRSYDHSYATEQFENEV